MVHTVNVLNLSELDLEQTPISISLPPYQSLFVSSYGDKITTEIAIQYWDTVKGQGIVEYLHCKYASCSQNLTKQSLDEFRVSKGKTGLRYFHQFIGPWNPSISISSSDRSTWLFYFKYAGKDLYALHCPKEDPDFVASCRNYVVSNETDMIENPDQVLVRLN